MEMDALRHTAAYEIEHPRQSVVAALAALNLKPGMRVLDTGCGPGPHLGLFAERVAPDGKVTGLDIDAERLEVATALWRKQIDAGAIETRHGDINHLPFDDGTFDVVWASAVLHHEAQPVETLRELGRVVRPGGRVAILDSDINGSFPFLPWPPELEQRLRAAYLRGEQDTYGGTLPYFFAGYMGRSLPRLLREAGLADVRLHPFADLDQAPLDAQREAELREWFERLIAGRLRAYLAPRDFEQAMAYFTPDSSDYVLASPDFFLVRLYLLGTGRVS